MKRVIFILLALCGLFVGLQAQNTNTTNQKGVTATGQLDTVRNTRLQPVLSDGPALQTGFVSPTGEKGNRPRLARTGQRLKAVIKVTSSSMVSNSVSATTATIAASVSDSGDYALPIIERGICYATSANPTLLTATKVIDANISGKGFGNFEVSLSGLQPNTAYHARIYAVSLYDTVYGEDLTFTTLIAGTLSGKFTINANGDQVYFSQGNLRATNTTANSTSGWTWSFAEHQYDYIGNNTANNKLGNNVITTAGTVDLFGWVGTNSSFAAYGINSEGSDSYYGNVTSEPLKSDWGHNVITNGGNAPDLWRTLTKDEWVWIIGPSSNANPGTNCRTSSTVGGTANARFTYATINGTYKGMIIFPDLYTAGTPTGVTWGTINNYSDNYNTTCTTEGWAALEAVGCVFLPAAGVRGGNAIYDVAARGNYWSSTSHESNAQHAYSMHFYLNEFNPANHYKRRDGYSIRLVHSTKNIGSLSYASTAVNKTTSDNTLFTNPLTHVGDGTVTYVRSAGDEICTVNATTGLVTLNGTIGTCTITATVNDSPLYAYNKKTASYTLTVTSVGALPGKFTVNASGDQVYFSQGNLQYQASSNTWRFAEHQWDYVGDASNGNVYESNVKCNNNNINSTYTGWIDLFGWGTGDNPTKSTQSNSDYNNFTAWGVNAISNGGNTTDMWRTLTKDEWVYLFNTRTTTSGVRYAKATVNNVAGIILLPDDWSTSYYTLSATNIYNAAYTSNEITLSDWTSSLESHGAVFLPAAGSRGSTVGGASLWGDYWSSSPYNSNDAYYVYIYNDNLTLTTPTGRAGGRSVRLVSETPFLGAGTEEDPYLISSKADWNHLANKVNSGINYSGKHFRQTANINNVTSMVGVYSDLWKSPFRGTYDGDGYTLGLSINTNSSFAGPFQYIENSTVKNVITTGSVSVQDASSYHPSGLVGSTTGICTIQNCLVSANVSGARHMGGIVGHCWTANISIIGCVYSGTLTPASGQWTGGILGWGGDGGGHTISISDCLFAGSFVYSTSSTKFHPIGILQNQSNTKNLSNTYYTLGAINTTDNESFVRDLSYKGKFARSITAGTGVTVAKAGTATAVYDVSGITSYGTGILYGGVLYAGNGEEISLTLSHAEAPSGTTFVQYTVTGGGTLTNPTSNSPTLTMTDADQEIKALNRGKFTVNDDGDQVYFSQGNLQAVCTSADNDGSTQESWSWQFAANQWDHIGNASANTSINGNGSVSTAGTVDLFGWVGVSSDWTGAAQYGISSAGWEGGYGTSTSDALKSDWGNIIGSSWRTLTGGDDGEWNYILNTRTSGSTVNGTPNARYTQATINTDGTSVNGLILFPDNVTIANSEATSWGTINGGSSWETKCTSAQWAALEAKGCVFLPAAGCRYGTDVNDYYVGRYGYYWSSTANESNAHYAYNVSFYEDHVYPNSDYPNLADRRDGGSSVRLVRNTNVLDLSTVTSDTIVPNGWTITGTLGENHKISIAADATVTLDDVNINGSGTWTSSHNAGINCLGNATIILADGKTNTIKGFHSHYPGIHIPQNYTLTIQGTGTLYASSNGDAAGIGGGYGIDCGNILIENGIINATGGNYAAGIGGGHYSTCGTIEIQNGSITATGGNRAAGIGGGGGASGFYFSSSCGDITISGGTVVATGGYQAAGIGSGAAGEGGPSSIGGNATCGNITISGGNVTATGGELNGGGAGIGSGKGGDSGSEYGDFGGNATCGHIKISGGIVLANGGDDAAGIGSGCGGNAGSGANGGNASCGNISIEGGGVTAMGGYDGAGIGSGSGGRGYYGNSGDPYDPGDSGDPGDPGETSGGSGNRGGSSSCGNISISGGEVTSTSEYNGAGIGSGASGDREGGIGGNSSCDDISITSGTVIVTLGYNGGAGIGSGSANMDSGGGGTDCDNITISGGTVTITVSGSGAGIGSGEGSDEGSASCDEITISGGTVTVTASNGTGIGSGEKGQCGDIYITDNINSVSARSSSMNKMGRGYNGSCGNIYFDNVKVYNQYYPGWRYYDWDLDEWSFSEIEILNDGDYGGLTFENSGDTWTLTPTTP